MDCASVARNGNVDGDPIARKDRVFALVYDLDGDLGKFLLVIYGINAYRVVPEEKREKQTYYFCNKVDCLVFLDGNIALCLLYFGAKLVFNFIIHFLRPPFCRYSCLFCE